VREVLETVRKISGENFPIDEQPRRAGDPPMLIARADRIRDRLGWTPRYDDLETIVSTALEWEKKLQARADP
jgi:UDP-glucose 4-epimerase